MITTILNLLFAGILNSFIITLVLAMCECHGRKKMKTSKSAKETKPNEKNAEVKKSPVKDKDKSSGNNKSTPRKCLKKKHSKSNKEESKSPKEKSEVLIEEHKKQSEINPTTAATVPVQSIKISGGEIFENAPNDEKHKVAKKNQAKSNQEPARVIQLPTGKIVLRGNEDEAHQSHPLPENIKKGLVREPYRPDEDTLYDVARYTEMPDVDLWLDLVGGTNSDDKPIQE